MPPVLSTSPDPEHRGLTAGMVGNGPVDCYHERHVPGCRVESISPLTKTAFPDPVCRAAFLPSTITWMFHFAPARSVSHLEVMSRNKRRRTRRKERVDCDNFLLRSGNERDLQERGTRSDITYTADTGVMTKRIAVNRTKEVIRTVRIGFNNDVSRIGER